MKKGFLSGLLHDTAMAAAAGLVLAGGLSLVLLLAGLVFNGFDFRGALVVVRGGLLVVGAFDLFVCAGLLLRNRDNGKLRDNKTWNRYFKVFGLFPVLILTAVVLLTAASLLDYYLYF